MRKNTLFCLIVILFSVWSIQAQEEVKYQVPEGRVIGINFSPLIFGLAPLANGDIGTRHFGHTYKKWGKRTAFRFTLGMGVFVGDFNSDDDELRFYIGLGWERPSRTFKRWRFHRGAEIAAFTGSLQDRQDVDESFSLGYIPFYEVMYDINDMISVGTSAKLVFAFDLSNATPVFRIIPPLDIMAYVRF